MIELRRDPETGEVVAYEDGRKVGSVSTMGDVIEDRPTEGARGQEPQRAGANTGQ